MASELAAGQRENAGLQAGRGDAAMGRAGGMGGRGHGRDGTASLSEKAPDVFRTPAFYPASNSGWLRPSIFSGRREEGEEVFFAAANC